MSSLIVRLVYSCFALLLSPLGYLREVMLCAGLLAAALCALTSVQTCVENRSAASGEKVINSCISRLAVDPYTDQIYLLQDFREIVSLDSSGLELHQRTVPTLERFHFGRDASGWAFVGQEHGDKFIWWHSTVGESNLMSQEETEEVVDASLSHDGRHLAVLKRGAEIRLWQMSDDGPLAARRYRMPRAVSDISLSPLGGRIVVQSGGANLQWLNAATGEALSDRIPLGSLIWCTAWSQDENWFAAGTEDRQIRIWNARDLSAPASAIQVDGMPMSLALTADGRWLVAGMSGGELKAWHDGELKWSRQAHHVNVRAIDLSGDEQRVVTACGEGRITVHNVETGEFVSEIKRTIH